ncbi:NorM family multidrug efflux MATE transporter, partial [Pseudomonas aeruginosa]
VLGALANLALNYSFIEGLFGLPRLGLAGIGLVTALVMNCMPLLLALYIRLQPAYAEYSLLRGLGRPQRAMVEEILRLGLPIGGTYAVESGMFTVATLCMGIIGDHALAAHQIAIQAVYVAFMVPVGLSYATTYRIGQHFGAGRLLEARRAGRVGIGFGALCMLLFAGLFWWMPEAIIGLFLDRDAPANREVAAMAVSLLAIAAWFELFDGTQNVAMGAIRGLKDARTTFLVGLACYWLVGVPLACLLAFAAGWGAAGVWWGLAGGLACAAIGLTLAFEWKTARLLPKATASEASALNCRAAGRGAPSARRCPGNAPVPPTAAAD